MNIREYKFFCLVVFTSMVFEIYTLSPQQIANVNMAANTYLYPYSPSEIENDAHLMSQVTQ